MRSGPHRSSSPRRLRRTVRRSANKPRRFERLESRDLLSADPLFRINAGGPELAGAPAWAMDTDESHSPHNNYDPGAITSRDSSTGQQIDLSHPSVPSGAPEAVFQSTRFDRPNQPNLEWDFPVAPGDYEVRLYFAEIWSGGFSSGAREFDVEIEGVEVLDDYDIFETAGALTGVVETFVVTSDANLDIDFKRNPGKNNPTVSGIEVVPVGGMSTGSSTASSHFAAAPGGSITGSSTFKNGSFVVQNTSSDGEEIESVTIDLSTGFLRDMVFDPFGGAGDNVAKPFTPNSGVAATGQNGFSYLSPHDDGFDGLEITFDDFEPGEEFTFAIDVDPTSIRASSQPGPGQSGSVSGLEIAGATITVTYDDGTTQIGELFPVAGSGVNAEVTIEDALPAAPTIELLGAPPTPSILTSASQTLRVTGNPGDEVRVFQAESGLFLNQSPFDIDPFETNRVLDVTHGTATIGAGGFVDVSVTLEDSQTQGGVNHFFVAVEGPGGVTGALSNKLIVALNDLPPGSNQGGDTDGPTAASVAANPAVATAAPVTVTATVTDALSDVSAAEYFIDAVGAEGSGVALAAADGSFNSLSESVTGVIGTAAFDALSDGTHTVFIRGQDAEGNWGAVASTTFEKATVPNSPPVTTGVSATPTPSVTGPISVSASVTDASDTVVAAEYFVDAVGAEGSGVALAAADGSFDSLSESVVGTISAAAFDTLAIGQHTLFVRGQDAAGNWGAVASTAFEKTADPNTPPVTTNVSASPSPTISGPITVLATVTDAADAVAAAEYFIDVVGPEGTGTPLLAVDGGFDTSSESVTGLVSSATVNGLSAGTHTVFVRGQDAQGAWGAVASATFVKDVAMTDPVTSNVVATPNPALMAPVTVTADVADADGTIVAVEGFLNDVGPEGSGIPLAAADGAFNSANESAVGVINAAMFNFIPVGTHTIFLRAQDNNGNWGPVAGATFLKLAELPGDFNDDDVIDSDDYDIWAATFGSTEDLRADANGNGIVDAVDYSIWRTYEGQTATTFGTFPAAAAAALVSASLLSSDAVSVAGVGDSRDEAFAELGSANGGGRSDLLLLVQHRSRRSRLAAAFASSEERGDEQDVRDEDEVLTLLRDLPRVRAARR